MAEQSEAQLADQERARRHIVVGWAALCLFACLGTTLEALHGFKVAAYLDVGNETRRLMWRLAHAHGALLAVVHVLWGLTSQALKVSSPWASRLMAVALVLLPAGFFLAGTTLYGGGPGLFIFLVPPGALAFVVGLAVASWATLSTKPR